MTNHDAIRRWAEESDARPARVRVDEQDEGQEEEQGDESESLRFEMAGETGDEALQEVSWTEWFRVFDENELALVIPGAGEYRVVPRSEVSQEAGQTQGTAGRSKDRSQGGRTSNVTGGRGGQGREAEKVDEEEEEESTIASRGRFGETYGESEEETGMEPGGEEEDAGAEEEEAGETRGQRGRGRLRDEEQGEGRKSARKAPAGAGGQSREANPQRGHKRGDRNQESQGGPSQQSQQKNKDKNRNRPNS